ncbi:MAG: caspase family protein [Telmatospirillum sp.]|nr:caspase family protein [Telmatospirillum sp.]
MVLLFRALAVAFAVVAATAPASASRKVALVIGNGAYAEAPLKNPTNDARAVAAKLRQQGFEVVLRENATKTQMNDVVADFGEKLSAGDTALFFFAGHGIQVQGRNYLIPTDARITSEQRVRLETLDVEAVLDQMAAARVSVSMVILDACRNNPFERRFRSVGGGLAQISAPEGTMIAYATAPGKVAADGEGANGLYTQELLKALSQPGLKVEDVFKQVRIGVARASGGSQVPWEASSLTGDFYFQPLASGDTAVVDREAVFWNSVKDSTNAIELRAYLDAFPNGTYAIVARARLANLEASPQQLGAGTSPGRVLSRFNGSYTATLPGGILVAQRPYTFLQIDRGVVRISAQDGGGTVGLTNYYSCLGQGSLDPNGAFADIEIVCETRNRQTETKTFASGAATVGGPIRVAFEDATGKKTEIIFK